MGVRAAWEERARRLTLRLAAASRMRPPLARDIVVRLAGGGATRSVVFKGRPVAVRF
jgi:hypothetical protein